MGGLRGLLNAIWNGTEQRSLSNPDSELLAALGASSTVSGISVSPESAMQMSAVWACVRLISESIASLPLHVYRRVDVRTRERVSGPLVHLLHSEPNRIMSSFTWRETMAAHVLLWGNGYSLIVRRSNGEPLEFLPVASKHVKVLRTPGGYVAYDVVLPDGMRVRVPQTDMLHIPSLAFDGVVGVSPIRYAAQSIGLALAAEQYGAAFFGNGSTPSGYISLPGKINKEQAAVLRETWYATYGGVKNSHKTAVLFENGKFERISIPPEEAQFIETRKHQVADIARWYRVPPHMIGDLDKATFSNIEHQQLEFVTHTLRPWLVRFEQEINRKLFPSRSDGMPSDTYAEFSVDGLLRGDVASRSDYYVKGRQWGWLSANDVRALENLGPIAGGDVYMAPLNMDTVGDSPSTVDEVNE